MTLQTPNEIVKIAALNLPNLAWMTSLSEHELRIGTNDIRVEKEITGSAWFGFRSDGHDLGDLLCSLEAFAGEYRNHLAARGLAK